MSTGLVATGLVATALGYDGAVTVNGTIAVTESDDVNSGSVSVSDSGTMAIVESNDGGAATGTATNSGSIASSEASDANATNAEASSPGAISDTEQNDASALSGTSSTSAASGTVEQSDLSAASGTVAQGGSIASSEANDTQAGAGTVVNSGSIAPTETSDVNSAFGVIIFPGVSGILLWTETNDTMSAFAHTGPDTFVEGKLNTWVIKNPSDNPVTRRVLPVLTKTSYDSQHYNIDLSSVLLPDGAQVSTLVSIDQDQGNLTFGSFQMNDARTIVQLQISEGTIPDGESELSCTLSLKFTSTLSPDQLKVSMVLILRYNL